jgi:DNA replication and repair protein RecF
MAAITRLVLDQYRNHAAATITARPGLVVITGDNGAGKTNILEAISMLAPGRGLRGAALPELARRDGPGGWAVAATLEDGAAGSVTIGTGIDAAAPGRRQVRVNGAAASATVLADWLALLWLTPAMDRLFAETPGGRRRFLDRLVLALHPGHGRQVARYEAAMRERARLLAGDGPADPAWLAGLETQMHDSAVAVAGARSSVVAALAGALEQAAPGPFVAPLIALAGNDADDLAARLARGRARDAAAGRAIDGPHRADLVVHHRAHGMPAAACSTGEQKAMLIAILLAHAGLVAAGTGRPPILLLDEVAAHLDAGRRAALFAAVVALGGQAWATGTDPALFSRAPAATWLRVEAGEVRDDAAGGGPG